VRWRWACAAVTVLTGCTPRELEQWDLWHAQDPAAAEHYAAEQFPQSSRGHERTVWDRLAECESGGNWHISTGNGYFGGLQFSLSAWRAVGGTGYPHQASREEQISRAERLLDLQGWGAWPACSRRLGLR
jgi:Transglycosylase-like domain